MFSSKKEQYRMIGRREGTMSGQHLFLILAMLLNFAVAKETEVRAHAGSDVTLPCRVDINQCGTLHSVKWYRDTSRIYVFSQAGKVARAEGDATERMTVEYNESDNETLLKISPVEVEDEATYKCEITYLEVRENCDVVQIVKLTTLVKPTSIRILGPDGKSLSNSTKLKPQNEGTTIEVTCEALGGKPIPTVSWYNGTKVMRRASYSAQGESNGIGNGVSKLPLTLSRGDLTARFECKVESEALEEPIISWISVDVNVRPTKMEISGVKGHVVQGSRVYLTCDVYGARPAATVSWYNGSDPIKDSDLIQTIPEDSRDGTFVTKSSLIFEATRWENGRSFNCYAENEVMKSIPEPPLHKLVFLDVRFPPVIRVSALKTIVKEGENIMLSCTYYANPQKLVDATWLKDGKNFTRIPGKHLHGNTEMPSLHILNISRHDMGVYTCWLKNEIAATESDESIFLDVHFPPDVEVIMEPSTPVKALDRGNVTLECNVTSGNPPVLRKVQWFLGGELMTELPECNYSQPASNDSIGGGPFCGIDPSILSLIKVEESFAGNYTCRGENDAGYGPESEPQELIVYYPPTPAKLRYYPSTVIKKGSVTLECTVDHPGRPDNVTYIWYRGSHQIHNVTVSNWTIQQASLETRSNFTCIALNEGGQSQPATVAINVLAPPAFINTLVSYKGVLFSSENVSLTCRIECFPLCNIVWYKDKKILTTNNPLYYINNTVHPANYNKNDFESIESTLHWNMSNWPGKQLNKSAPHSDYTCASVSTENLGPHVNFTTEIAIDFPPEELDVSKHQVDVIENETPISVKCFGKGRPKLNYLWRKNYTSEPIVKDDTLQLGPMSKSAAGSYVCEAWNKYGRDSIQVYFNVQYKPDCKIEMTEKDGNRALVCIAKANPQEVSFTWKIRESNDTIEYDNIINEGLNSYLILDSSVDTLRTYQCISNNSVGAGLLCERTVPGMIPWYKRLGRDNLIIIIVSIVTLIICFIVVCIVIIIMCRRKRANTKCNNPLEMEEREKPEGESPNNSTQSKWPLKPGILVHVNKMHPINISRLSPSQTPFKNTSVTTTSALLKYRKNKSKVYARLQRLSDYLRFSGNDRVPNGITMSASGVVTYKKIKPTSPRNTEPINMRKRKKPGYDAPNQSSTGDKMRLGAAPPVGGIADPAKDPDKGFYENLPFHGMQNPPNKPISVIAPFSQDNTLQFNQPAKLFTPSNIKAFPTTYNKPIQRHQSFHGFQNNQYNMQMYYTRLNFNRNFSNPYLNSTTGQYFQSLLPNWPYWDNLQNQRFYNTHSQIKQPFQGLRFTQSQSNFQPLLNFNPLLCPNPFSIPPQNKINRVIGRKESDIRRTASGINPITSNDITFNSTKADFNKLEVDKKRFGSLELKKHKCYSPTFYSMRCKKHAKKRPVIYALPKKLFTDENKSEKIEEISKTLQIQDENLDESEKTLPIPAPRCKKHRKEIIYQNIAEKLSESLDITNSSNESSDNVDGQISVTLAQVHSPKETETKEDTTPKLVGVSPKPNAVLPPETLSKIDSLKAMKNSPVLKVSPNFVKPKIESPKGALSLQIQAKRKSSMDKNENSNSTENLPQIPQMSLLPQNKWSPSVVNPITQNAFYTLTTPHYKHLNTSLPPQYSATIPHQKHATKLIPRALFNEQLQKSKSFSSKPKHKKHFQIPLQKCHSFKFQTAESYFQPIKNIHEEDLMKNGYVSDYPEPSNKGRHHKRDKMPKQKTKGPLVLRRASDFHEQFQENVQNSVQLQYPQPILGRNLQHSQHTNNKPNGVVYADLDMPKTNKKKSPLDLDNTDSKNQKSKSKTEYATLSFNDIGQEIDV